MGFSGKFSSEMRQILLLAGYLKHCGRLLGDNSDCLFKALGGKKKYILEMIQIGEWDLRIS